MTQAGDGYILTPEAPQGPLTARNLEDYALCPQRYLLSHFTTRKRTGEFIGGPAALTRAVRPAILEAYASGAPDAYPVEQALKAFEEAWDGSACRDSLEEEELHRAGKRIIEQHYARPFALPGPLKIDVRMEIELSGHKFIAVADILQPDPPVALRLTTSRKPAAAGQLSKELSTAMLWLAARDHLGVEALNCWLADLRGARQIEYALDAQQQAELESRMVSLAGRIRGDDQFTPLPGKYCRRCRSHRECPAKKR